MFLILIMVQICFSKEEKKELTSELRNKIEEAFKESFNYDGDGNDIENGDYDMFFYKTPLGLPINDDKPIIIEEEGDFGDLEQEKKTKELQQIGFDLNDEEDVKGIESELKGKFFKPENDVTYKFVLNSSKVIKVDKMFDDGPVTKYGVDVTISDKNGEVFNGIWEIGNTILKVINKNYKENATFSVTKSGSGLETRYNVVADF